LSHRKAALSGMVIAGACVLVFFVIGVHELDYASNHPGQYGPAKVIAWAAFAGAALSSAVCLLAYVGIRLASGSGQGHQ
jgi:RsiW-degrading membrane proteinase PrsW (M82 family)